MRNSTTSPAETQVLDEKGSHPFEGDALKTPTVSSFPTLRVTFSQCDGVYDGDGHWAIIEDRPCGTILADVDVGPESLPLATLFAASPDLLVAAKLALRELDRIQECSEVTPDEQSWTARAALHSAIEKARVRS